MTSPSSNQLAAHVASSRSATGAYAAADIASEIRALLAKQEGVRILFAAAPSQSEMLQSLIHASGVDWSRVTGFHMDEYLDLAFDAPQRFGAWLRRNLFDHLPFGAIHLIESGNDAKQIASDYAAKLNAAPIDIVCCGVGVNGHLAFNDPPADFSDPETVKVVALDERSRQQQVDDECFAAIQNVPTHAVTVTIPAMLAARAIFCIVPGSQKNRAMRNMLEGPITPLCPATALRLHPHCTVYLDRESARDIALDNYRLV